MRLRCHHKILAPALAALFILIAALRGEAVTFTVNSTADGDDANKGNLVCATAGGVCTLRAAISEANASFGSGPHTVSIPAGIYTLTGVGDEDGNTTGDLDVLKPMTISGAGVELTIIDGNGVDRVMEVGSSSVTISGVTIRNGACQSGQSGGGILFTGGSPLTLSGIRITSCSAYDGGGMVINSGGLNATNITISNCSAGRKGGGLFVNSPPVTITNATFSNNSAVMDGGAVHTQTASNSTFTNVTMSGNSTPGLGGAYFNNSGNTMTLINCTLAYNSAGTGGGIYGNGGNISLKNTIVTYSSSGGNCSGSIVSSGYNMDSGSSCPFSATGDRPNSDPKLGVLQNNGGSMLTHALIIGSPAIDTATAAGAPATDQRGIARPYGSAYDMGAYEGVFVPAYQPDAMVRLASEAVTAYLTDNTYEGTASAQIKNGGAMSGEMTSYNMRFQNDGNVADTIKITGTGSGSGFTIQYLDETSVDRTAAVTAGGHNLPLLVPGEAREWTLKVGLAGGATPVRGGASYNIAVTATSVNDGTKKDQVLAVPFSMSANFSPVRTADKAIGKPGDDISYTTTATNDSSTKAINVLFLDTIPPHTGFKVASGNPSFDPMDSGLTSTISYSANNRSSWNYTPVSGGCSAPPSYDYCVTDVQWATAGEVLAGKSFKVGITVRVK
jgi:CSLREA domain-containing protein/uncharacterized repeat protein (TIGR01451 family)